MSDDNEFDNIEQWMDDAWAYAQEQKGISAQHLNMMMTKLEEYFENDVPPEDAVEELFGQRDEFDEGANDDLGIHHLDAFGAGMPPDEIGGYGFEPENPGPGDGGPGGEHVPYCEKCSGIGMVGDDPCEACQGQGYIGEGHKFTPGNQPQDKKDREEASRSKTKPGKGKWSRADGKKIKTDEGFTMNLKEFFVREGRFDSKMDPDDWRDQRRDAKIDFPEEDYIDTQPPPGPSAGDDKYANEDEERYGDFVMVDSGLSMLMWMHQNPEEWKKIAHEATENNEYPEDWMLDRGIIRFSDDSNHPNAKMSESDTIGHTGKRDGGEKEWGKMKSDRRAARNTKEPDFGEDPDDDMFFGSKDDDDNIGTMIDPADDGEFKGGKVDDFGDDELEPALFDPDSDVQSTWGPEGHQEAPGSDVNFPEYEPPKRDRYSHWWDEVEKHSYKPPADTARHSDIEKAGSFPDYESEEIKALLRGKK
jgi:hypothetical protein